MLTTIHNTPTVLLEYMFTILIEKNEDLLQGSNLEALDYLVRFNAGFSADNSTERNNARDGLHGRI